MDGETVTKNDIDSSTETEDESESAGSLQSPVYGSINYFVAPLDSSETQAMMIEELNQVRQSDVHKSCLIYCKNSLLTNSPHPLP